MLDITLQKPKIHIFLSNNLHIRLACLCETYCRCKEIYILTGRNLKYMLLQCHSWENLCKKKLKTGADLGKWKCFLCCGTRQILFNVYTTLFLKISWTEIFWSVKKIKKKPRKTMWNICFHKDIFFFLEGMMCYLYMKLPRRHRRGNMVLAILNGWPFSVSVTCIIYNTFPSQSKSQNHSRWWIQHYAEFRPHYLGFCPVRYLIIHT